MHAAADGVESGWLETAGPVLVWIIVLSFIFCECAFIVGLFLPGDSLLFGAGVVLASHGAEVQAWVMCGAALVVAILGNQVGYHIGRYTGTKLAARSGAKVLNQHNLARARSFLDRRGFLAVVAARWIPWIRTLAPLIAGAARMSERRFLLGTSLGGLLWVPTLVLAGYYFAGFLSSVPWLMTVLVWCSIGVFAVGTAFGVWRYRQDIERPVDELADDGHARAP